MELASDVRPISDLGSWPPPPHVLACEACEAAPCFKGSGLGSAAASAATWGSSGVGSWAEAGGWGGEGSTPSSLWYLGRRMGQGTHPQDGLTLCSCLHSGRRGDRQWPEGRRFLVQLRCLTPRHAEVPEAHLAVPFGSWGARSWR